MLRNLHNLCVKIQINYRCTDRTTCTKITLRIRKKILNILSYFVKYILCLEQQYIMLGEFSLKSAQQKQQQKKNPELISLLFKTSPFLVDEISSIDSKIYGSVS